MRRWVVRVDETVVMLAVMMPEATGSDNDNAGYSVGADFNSRTRHDMHVPYTNVIVQRSKPVSSIQCSHTGFFVLI